MDWACLGIGELVCTEGSVFGFYVRKMTKDLA